MREALARELLYVRVDSAMRRFLRDDIDAPTDDVGAPMDDVDAPMDSHYKATKRAKLYIFTWIPNCNVVYNFAKIISYNHVKYTIRLLTNTVQFHIYIQWYTITQNLGNFRACADSGYQAV